MPVVETTVIYLPLSRRAGLVRAFARLVRAMPQEPKVLSLDLPAHLRRDVGLPPVPKALGPSVPPRPPTCGIL